MNSAANRWLLVLVLLHAAASLLHFVHNAAFLDDYPNMPDWVSPAGIYTVWFAEASIGALGVMLLLRGRKAGLVLTAIYAVLGLGGLDHYTLAPVSAHTVAMNATIWLETATAVALLLFVGRMFAVRMRQAVVLLFAVAIGMSMSGSSRAAETPRQRIVPIAPLSQDTEVSYGDEHLTVVQGRLYFAVSDKFDLTALQEIKAGGYAFVPNGSTMFGYIPDGAIVQVHGVSPFRIRWRAGKEWLDHHRTLADPDSRATFKFVKGEKVIAKRGPGVVRQGYFSGEFLQYEIEGAGGTLFMAKEDASERYSLDPGHRQRSDQ